MTELFRVEAVDVETLMIDALAGWLPTAGWAGIRVAESLPGGDAEGVAVYRTGGPMRDLVIDQPTIAIDAKATTKTLSCQLIQACRSWAHHLTQLGGYGVSGVGEFAGPANLPTDDSPTRYTMTITLGIQARLI